MTLSISPEAAAAIDQQLVADLARARSVVKGSYKVAYAERVKAGAKGKKGVSKKVQARCCGDWLALELAARTTDPKTGAINVSAFEAILSANGVAHEHWNRTTKGWQGRLRMTGRLALQKVVAEADGELELPEGARVVAPRSWVAKFA